MFLMFGGSIKETVKKGVAWISNHKDIARMNAIQFNSAHLSDDQLLDCVGNKVIDKFERIGYAAAFADQYPPSDQK